MGVDDYILGLLAIISGLAISDMVGGLHRLLAHRRRIRWHWLTPLTALLVAYTILAAWWVSWVSWHGRSEPVVLGWFLLPVGQLVCLYVAGRATLPDELPHRDEPSLDLAQFYFETKRYVWGALAVETVLIFGARAHALGLNGTDTSRMGLNYPTLLFGVAYYSTLAFVDNRWVHRIGVPAAFVIVVMLTIGRAISN